MYYQGRKQLIGYPGQLFGILGVKIVLALPPLSSKAKEKYLPPPFSETKKVFSPFSSNPKKVSAPCYKTQLGYPINFTPSLRY